MSRPRLKGRILFIGSALVLLFLLAACSSAATATPPAASTPTAGPTTIPEPTLVPTAVPTLTPTVASTPTFTVPPSPTPLPQDTTPLIPRQVLFGNPDKASAKLSPNGTRISYRAPLDGVLNVWVGPVDDPGAAKPVTSDTGRGIHGYFWAFTNEHIIYVQDEEGDENWRFYSVDLTTNQPKDLTPLEGVQARIQEVSPDFPDEIMIGLNDRNPQLHDLYRVNIRTGEKQLVQENQGFASFLTDDEFNVRFAFRLTPDGGNEVLRPTEEGGWELFMKIEMEDVLTTRPAGFDKTAGFCTCWIAVAATPPRWLRLTLIPGRKPS